MTGRRSTVCAAAPPATCSAGRSGSDACLLVGLVGVEAARATVKDVTVDQGSVVSAGQVALTAAQRRVVDAAPGPLLVVAGAGSGKTSTVTARIAGRAGDGSLDPAATLAVTHSRRAAGELRDRLVVLGADGVSLSSVAARTFHSVALEVCSRFWPATGLPGAAPEIVGSKWRLVADAAAAVTGSRDVDAAVVSDLVSEVSWAQVSCVDPGAYASAATRAGRRPPLPAPQVAAVAEAFAARKRALAVVDFEDLLAFSATVLVGDEAAAVWSADRFRHFVVDEYQDTDAAQQRLLDALVGPAVGVSGVVDVCAVGDVRQAIYGFKGGDVSFLAGFTDRWPGAAVVTLGDNFRSSPQIVAAANRVARLMAPATPDGLVDVDLVACRADGPAPEVCVYERESAESAAVARRVAAWVAGGVAASEIAVLFRYNASRARFEAALRDAGVPVAADDNEDNYWSRDDVLSVLRPFGEAARAEPSADAVAVLLAAARTVGWDPDDPPAGQGAVRARWEARAVLVDMAVDLAARNVCVVASELLAEFLARARDAAVPAPSGVAVLSMHRAKGLEWDCVVVGECVEGAVPSAFATTDEQLEEELRLFYVAVTRARRELVCTASLKRPSRRGDGRSWSSKPSRWLPTIRSGMSPAAPPVRAGAGASGGDGGSGRARSGGCGRCGDRLVGLAQRHLGVCPDCLTGPPAALLSALEGWRDDVGVASGVAAKRVCGDRALLSVVAFRPGSLAELAKIAGFASVDPGDAAAVLEIVAGAG